MWVALKMEHTLRNVQKQKMMPQTLQSLQLLSMPLFALKSYLNGIVVENPFLEPRYDMMEIPLSACAAESGISEDDDGAESFDPGAGLLPFREQIYSLEGESLYEHLSFQARMCPFSVAEAAVARYLISNINTAGYLEVSLEDTASQLDCDGALAERVLHVIQSFSPRGVGARSLSECLCLQADPQIADYGILIRLLREDLSALAERRFKFLTCKYKLSRLCIQHMLDYVQTLDPKPGNCFIGTQFTPYLTPDATVTPVGSQLKIWIGGKANTLLSFNREYMKDVTDVKAAEFLRQKRSEAVNLLNGITMRNRALELLVGYLAEEQHAFFPQGAAALRPLTQRKAAADLGMSPSTISRCVQGKYVGTPWGCLSLSYFFSADLDGNASATQARHEIGALIAQEDKAAPLSDLAIAEHLAGKGIRISRRTVAKYRGQLALGGRLERIRYA
jgi:RNA polymerase sigma-54 factor